MENRVIFLVDDTNKMKTVLCRSLRKSLADVWREASGEKENPSLQMQPQPNL